MLATLQQYAGRYRLAAGTALQAFEQAGHAKAPDAQALILLQDAIGKGLGGSCEGNEVVVRQAFALDKSRQTGGEAALAAALCGNGRLAFAQAQELSKRYPEDTSLQDVMLPLAKAFAALSAGRSQEAIDAAQPVKRYDANYPGFYVQGLAYLQLHDGARAVNAFDAARRARSGTAASLFPPYWAQVQFGLARAYVMTGNKAEARKSYQQGFQIWKDADADLPC